MYNNYNSFNDFNEFGMAPHTGMASGVAGGVAAMVIGFLIVFYLILLAYIITNYVLRSIGLYRVGKKNGVENAWLAWIPIGNLYVLGKAAGDVSFGKRTITKMPLWLILIQIIGVGVIMGSYIGFLVTMIGAIASTTASGMAEAGGALAIVCAVMFVVLMVSAILYSILWYLFYGMTYFTLCKKYKSTNRSVFYLLMSLFVPLADAIIMFKLGKAEFGSNDEVTAQISESEVNESNTIMGE